MSHFEPSKMKDSSLKSPRLGVSASTFPSPLFSLSGGVRPVCIRSCAHASCIHFHSRLSAGSFTPNGDHSNSSLSRGPHAGEPGAGNKISLFDDGALALAGAGRAQYAPFVASAITHHCTWDLLDRAIAGLNTFTDCCGEVANIGRQLGPERRVAKYDTSAPLIVDRKSVV